MDEATGKLLIAAFIAFGEFAAAAFFYHLYQRIKRLDSTDAAYSNGTITERRMETQKVTSYSIRYRFKSWKGEDFKGNQSLSRTEWESFEDGQAVMISYLRNKPSINALRSHVGQKIKLYRIISIITMAAPLVVLPVLGIVLFQMP